jgi:hypothetical protein
MKTNNKLLLFVLALLMTIGFTITSCEKSEVVPSNTSVLEKRGGGGNPNNPNTPGYNPCANYPVYPIVNIPSYDFNISMDTTACGTIVFNWNAQPGFNPVIDSCYTIARYYYISFAPVGHTNGCTGGGSLSNTNRYYYTLGAGCSVWPGYNYVMGITYYERNSVDQKVYVRASLPFYFTAPKRAVFLNNC